MTEGQRRLAAIMFTDMVGYTTLGQKNETLSLALVEEQRKLVRPILVRHDGREVKTIGDAFLVEFSNALEALRCAYDIQRAIREFNISLPSDKRLHLRIGIHVGDVVEHAGDISGDAVNVASRVEPLAEDDGVALSRQVYDHVQNKFDLPLQSLGPVRLKNVDLPIEIFKVQMPWETKGDANAEHLDRKRVAVLPFVNMSPESSDEYFVDGITEELIATVSKIGSFSVISRTSVMKYKGEKKAVGEIGKELRAGSVLEGSVRKGGDKVRITVQLIDVVEDKHLWADSYDRRLDDIFVVQSEIAEKVANSLKVRLLGDERERIEKAATRSTEAHTLYLKGRFYWNERTEEGLRKAIKYFEEAIEKDPQYSHAFAGLADSYGILVNYGYISPTEGLQKAKSFAIKSIELDASLAEAHSALAVVLWNGWDFKAAGRELRTALDLNPSYARAHQWYGDYLHYVEKKPGEAIAEKKRSRDLDPFSPIANLNVGAIYCQLEQYDEAIQEFKDALETFPDYWNLHDWLGMTLALKGDYNEGIAELLRALELSKNASNVRATLGGVYALAGRLENAKAVISELTEVSSKEYVSPIEFAYIYTCMKDKDKAFGLLKNAFEQHSSQLPETLLGDPVFFRILGEDPRFQDLLDKLGLGKPVTFPHA